MIFNVEIDNRFNSENEKNHAYSLVNIFSNSINWDSVIGYLEFEKSFIMAETEIESKKIKASLFDSLDLAESIFNLEYNGLETTVAISHNELEQIMKSTENSFIGALNNLVEKSCK